MKMLNVPLSQEETRALGIIAADECRDMRQMLRYLLRLEASRRGLLAAPTEVEHWKGDSVAIAHDDQKGGNRNE